MMQFWKVTIWTMWIAHNCLLFFKWWFTHGVPEKSMCAPHHVQHVCNIVHCRDKTLSFTDLKVLEVNPNLLTSLEWLTKRKPQSTLTWQFWIMLWSCMFNLQAVTSFDDHANDIFLPNQVEGAKPPVPTSFLFQKRKRPYHSLKHCGRWAWPLWNMYIPQQNIIYKEHTQEKRG